jgi:hypothetical protein
MLEDGKRIAARDGSLEGGRKRLCATTGTFLARETFCDSDRPVMMQANADAGH